MNVLDWVQVGSVVVMLLVGTGGVTTYLTNRHKAAAEKKTADAEERLTQLGVNIELQEYVDARVDKALAPVLAELEETRAMERARTRAMGRILRAIAYQWPADIPGPKLDPADIAAVEDAIPPSWLGYSGGAPNRKR